MNSQWISTKDERPEDGICVNTKIDDGLASRNNQNLIKKGNL